MNQASFNFLNDLEMVLTDNHNISQICLSVQKNLSLFARKNLINQYKTQSTAKNQALNIAG
jgi:hypothetical protein